MLLLKTNRLLIEKVNLNDADFFFELMNSPNFIKHIGDRNIKSVEKAKEYIQNNLMLSYKKNGYGFYKTSLKKDKTPIGMCGFAKRDYLDSADIGFAILPKHEGKGYTFEAATALLDYSTNTLNIHPIYGITTMTNSSSQKLLLKIGLQNIGTVKSTDENKEFLLFSI